MRFGLYFMLQLPRPWSDDSESALFAEALDQIELADQLGYDYAWAPEQHFLEEYSHSSAPEILLAAASQRTSRIRLGHAVALAPPPYNHPARLAERIATLDLVSAGRLDFGWGHSKSRVELEGFGIDPGDRRAMSDEAMQQIVRMLTMTPYPGHAGRFVTMPPRNVVPKPVQKPHPPLWIAASDDATIHRAAQLGVGVLTHGFADRAEAERVVADYYETFKRECVPLGETVNPTVASMNAFYCHEDADEAARVGRQAQSFATYSTRHYYAFGVHQPGVTDIHALEQQVSDDLGAPLPVFGRGAIGTPDQLADHVADQAAAGVDQLVLGHQAGAMPGAAIRASMSLFATKVMPRFAGDAARREAAKRAELAPFVREAFARKAALLDDSSPVESTRVEAFGRARLDADDSALPDETRTFLAELRRQRDVTRRYEE